MSTRTKLFIVNIITILVVFVGGSSASAQTVVANCNSATINGTVTPNGNQTDAWFEWGPTQSLGSSTSHQTFYSNSSFSQIISSLKEGSTYYYRAMASNSLGTATGSTKSFSTPLCPITTPAPTVNFSANPTSVSYGGSSVLTWSSLNADFCTLSGDWSGGAVTSGSSSKGSLTASKNYTITCTGSGGNTSKSLTVSVGSTPIVTPAPTIIFSANPTSVSYGGSSVLTWSSINATSCEASGDGWSGSRATEGNQATGSLYLSRNFIITCSGDGGSTAKSLTVSVGTQSVTNPTVSLTSDNSTLTYNNSTYIRWSSTNATSCVGTNFSTNNTTSGNFYTGSLTNTTTYSIICSNGSGSANDATTVTVTNQQNSGSLDVSTNSPTNIGENHATLKGYISSSGNSNASAWFEWGTNSNYNNQTNQISYGTTNGTNYSYYLSGLNENTRYYFRSVAQDSNGQIVYGNQITFRTLDASGCDSNCDTNDTPIVTTYSATSISTTSGVLNGYIDPNGSRATRWFEWGTNTNYLYTTTSKISQGTSSGNFSQSIYNLNPSNIYYYRTVAQGVNGEVVYGNILSFTTLNNNYYNDNTCPSGSCLPTAITSIATNIGTSGARLSGVGLVTNNISTTGYFEWGTTQSFGNATTVRNIGSSQSNPFYESLSNLRSNTTYYFRAVVTNQYGNSRGDIMSFRTIASNNGGIIYRNTTVVTNTSNTTGDLKPSPIFLDINRNNETIIKGSVIEYVVNYKNVSSKDVRDVVLQISIPKELSFVETSRGYLSTDNNTIVANIGNLNSKEEGSVRFTVLVTADAETNKIIVITANLAYTVTSDNTQGEVFAYTKNTIGNGTPSQIQQGALAFLSGDGFLPSTLIGWLLLLLVITLIVLAVRKMYYGPSSIVVSEDLTKK